MGNWDDMAREVERGELWLRENLVDPAPPDHDRIKLRVRVALGEAWLSGSLDESPDAEVIAHAKRGVGMALADAASSDNRHPRLLPSPLSAGRNYTGFLRWASGIGLAAAASLVVYVGFYGMNGAIPETPMINAFLTPFADEISSSLRAIDEDLAYVEQELQFGVATDAADVLIDDLNDWVDEVFDDLEYGNSL